MMSLNHIFRIYTGGCKLHKSQEKMNHLIYLNDINMLAKTEKKKKELETLIQTVKIYSNDIGMKFEIEKLFVNYEKQQTTYGRRNRTTKSRKKSERSEKNKIANTWAY